MCGPQSLTSQSNRSLILKNPGRYIRFLNFEIPIIEIEVAMIVPNPIKNVQTLLGFKKFDQEFFLNGVSIHL